VKQRFDERKTDPKNQSKNPSARTARVFRAASVWRILKGNGAAA
jgi:hypothetical protein